MQVSIKWLKSYIDFDWTAEELADKFTLAGVPVENVVRQDEGFEHVVTGRIEQITAHPDSDHLQVCQMNVGGKDRIQIITGAQNVREGQVVPVAMVGAHLPNGAHIKKGKLRGLPSNGMLCSAGELHLDTTHMTEEQLNGIYILPADTPVGVPAASVLGLDDAVLEFELTANRGDCFSVLGLVREIAVLSGNEPHWPEIACREDDAAKASDMLSCAIAAPELCQRYTARVIKNVKIGPSPVWMQERLEGAGIRAINNVVDVTNYVMVELGQPMHAYDYDQITGHTLTARLAKAGENLHTLDDSDRVAQGTELVIADSEHPAGLAGVMGGLVQWAEYPPHVARLWPAHGGLGAFRARRECAGYPARSRPCRAAAAGYGCLHGHAGHYRRVPGAAGSRDYRLYDEANQPPPRHAAGGRAD